MWIADGLGRASDGFPILLVTTSVFVANQRRLAAKPPNRGAARWIYASRAAVLTMLTLGTPAFGFYRIVPQAAPGPAFIVRGLFALHRADRKLAELAPRPRPLGRARGVMVSGRQQGCP
jgi:hypothetical protein